MYKMGDKISYKEDDYTILYIYDSGYVEIKKIDSRYIVELIHISEIERKVV